MAQELRTAVNAISKAPSKVRAGFRVLGTMLVTCAVHSVYLRGCLSATMACLRCVRHLLALHIMSEDSMAFECRPAKRGQVLTAAQTHCWLLP